VEEEGEGPKAPRDLNTPQEETNKFQVKISNLNYFFSSFDVEKILSSSLDLSSTKFEFKFKLELRF